MKKCISVLFILNTINAFAVTLPPPPDTVAADEISATTAKLHGSFSADPIVLEAVGFQYSSTTADLSSTLGVTSVEVCEPQSNARYCPIWAKVIPVECGKTYHFRARTTAALGLTRLLGATLSFKTPPCMLHANPSASHAASVNAASALKKP